MDVKSTTTTPQEVDDPSSQHISLLEWPRGGIRGATAGSGTDVGGIA